MKKSITSIYKKFGGTLFPCKGKVPISKGWQKRTYPIQHYITQGYNVGWAIPNDYIVIDIDPRNGGADSWAKLNVNVDKYTTVKTGGGGLHVYCKLPKFLYHNDIKSSLGKKYPGIDIKKLGGYVIVPPSIHPDSNKPYEFLSIKGFKRTVPKELIKLLKRTITKAKQDNKKTIGNKTLARLLSKLPVLEYRDNDSWFKILCASHSATNGKGLETFINWSTCDPKYKDHSRLIASRWQSLGKNKGSEITLQTLLAETLKYDKLQSIVTEKETKKDFNDENDGEPLPPSFSGDLAYTIARKVFVKKFSKGKNIMHGADLRYWIYNKRNWEILQSNMVDKILYKETVKAKLKNRGIKKPTVAIFRAAEQTLRAMCASSQNLCQISRKKSIINTQNFELHLNDKSGKFKLKKHKAKSFLTYCLETNYDPKATCPRFDQALLEIFEPLSDKEDVIRHLLEIFGYTIQAKKNIATWVLFQGRGANGKTVLLQILSSLLGDAALEKSVDDLNVSRNNHALADLPGKLALIDEDVSTGTILPDGALKKISENKMLVANPKGTATFRFMNFAIPILAANNWPSTRDLSEGLRRRAQVFNFTRQFSPDIADIQLADYIIENELAGVLNRALEGLQRLRARGKFDPPQSCIKAKNIWFMSNSQVHQFVEDTMVKSPGKGGLTFAALWKKYVVWTIDNGIRFPIPKTKIRGLLDDIGIRTETRNKRIIVPGWRLKK